MATRKKSIPQKDKKQLRDQMGGCALNVAAILGCSPDNVAQITSALTREIEEWCLLKARKIDPKTGTNELQEKMKQKINEVWPYGYCEVHGYTQHDMDTM